MKEKISKTLYVLRAVNRLTSKETAFQLGVSQSEYSKLETGRKDITLQRLKTIAEFYDIELLTLLEIIFTNDQTLHNQIKTGAYSAYIKQQKPVSK